MHFKTKPREKLLNEGASNLSDLELLAIILRSGGQKMDVLELADYLLKKYSKLESIFNCEINELIKNKYIGTTKAIEICAILEISKRIFLDTKTITTISKPEDAFNVLKYDLFEKKQEYLYLLSLDSRKRLISKDIIGIGTVNEMLVSPREVLRKALLKDAVYIIIAHNHPSNDATPSKEDLQITNKIDRACQKVEITLLDHIVIANNIFFSIKASNLEMKGGEIIEK